MVVPVQFMRFALTGILNTLVHMAVFMLLYRLAGMPVLAASALGYAAGVINSFVINRRWTFGVRGDGATTEFAKFLVVNLVSMTINLVLLQLLVDRHAMNPELAQVIAIAAALVVNYSGNRWWTFRQGIG